MVKFPQMSVGDTVSIPDNSKSAIRGIIVGSITELSDTDVTIKDAKGTITVRRNSLVLAKRIGRANKYHWDFE